MIAALGILHFAGEIYTRNSADLGGTPCGLAICGVWAIHDAKIRFFSYWDLIIFFLSVCYLIFVNHIAKKNKIHDMKRYSNSRYFLIFLLGSFLNCSFKALYLSSVNLKQLKMMIGMLTQYLAIPLVNSISKIIHIMLMIVMKFNTSAIVVTPKPPWQKVLGATF